MHNRKTIGKNRKKLIEEIRLKATNIKYYDQSSGDMFKSDNIDWSVNELFQYKNAFMSISDEGFGTIHIHSNRFVNFNIPNETLKKVFKYL